MAYSEKEILDGLAEIIDEIAGVPGRGHPGEELWTTSTSTAVDGRDRRRRTGQVRRGDPDDQLKDLKTVQTSSTTSRSNGVELPARRRRSRRRAR